MLTISTLGPATLGQASGGGLFGAPPPPLPAAPAWERWLLEAPLYPAAVLLLAAFLAFYLMNQSGKRRQGAVTAAALVAAAAAVLVLGSVVTTPREAVTARTHALVEAVARADSAAAADLLAPDLAVRPAANVPAMDRSAVLAFLDTQMKGQYKVENYRVMQVQAAVGGPNLARTQTHVRITPESYGAPVFTWWRLDWRKDEDSRWRVIAIEAVEVR